MNRREALQSLAALASSRWVAEGYDPERIEAWRTAERGFYFTATIEAAKLVATFDTPTVSESSGEDFTENEIDVGYSDRAVFLSLDGRGEDICGGAQASLFPEQARKTAVAIYMAAEELERRGGYDPA